MSGPWNRIAALGSSKLICSSQSSRRADEETLPQKVTAAAILVFTGQQEIDPAALTEATQGYLGQEVTVTELEQAAAAVTDYCRQQGYTVATAVLPQQNIQDGTVEIRIFLGL